MAKALAEPPRPPKQRMVEWDGRVQTLSAWSKETGLRFATISGRLRNGWSVEKTLSQPAKKVWRSDLAYTKRNEGSKKR